jgi:glycosyltransferase involved in cell wall biosynthesis
MKPKPPYLVLHVIDQLGIGGAQEVVCQLVKYSQPDLFHPEVLALRGLGHYVDVLQSWGVPVYSLLPEDHKIYSYFGGLSAHLLSKLFLFLTARRYDLVHTHLLWANMYATPMAALCRVPVRFNHDQAYDFVRYRERNNRFLRAISNRLTSHIIAVSFSIRNFLCQEENVSADKISVVRNSVDLNLFSPQNGLGTRQKMRKKWDLPAGALIVGGVGRLEQQKNFSLFLEVAAEVSAQLPQAMFVIAGEGRDRSLLEDLSRKLGIEKKVRFPGFVKEMPEFYQSLDLLLLTSDFEGTPLTVLEALAMGLPVVASKVDGSAEILEDGNDAFLVPPKDKELFVHKVCQLLADRDLAQRMALTGQKKVRYNYSAKDMVRQVEALYLKFLEKGGASA